MKNYRELYNKLESDLFADYFLLRNAKIYNFAQQLVDGWEDEDGKKELQGFLDYEDYGDMFDYDFFEDLAEIYFNNRHGDELKGYLLKVSTDGIVVLNDYDLETVTLSLEDISNTYDKITIVELLKDF